ncbi:radical SAM protein [Acetobacterium carbinolicum]|uniref:radical SAM protein n=1 Tax=Acetobacterium carbinolicum TaxID=52690 RepID=UPI0039C9E22A
MKSLLKLGLVYTYKCNASCASCCFECHPNLTEKMELKDALDYIHQAAASSTFDEIGISGGEALLYEDEVLKILDYASGLGLKTSLTTNGFWGNTQENALYKLELLKEKGLTNLVVSTDEFHQSFIDYDYIENILIANEIVGIPLKIYNLVIRTSSEHPLATKYKQCDWIKGACVPAGRAKHQIPSGNYIYGDYGGRCIYADKLTIMPDNFVYPCCSPGIRLKSMQLGSVSELSIAQLVQAKENAALLNIIIRRGPKWLKEAGEARGCILQNRQDEYVSICHLCMEIFEDEVFLQQMEPFIKEILAEIDYEKHLKREPVFRDKT